MEAFKVNQDKCVKCGICGKVCPAGIIKVEDHGPKLLFPNACLVCGQCVAVCPQEALDHEKTPLANQVNLSKFPVIDTETAANFLRSRRSIRCYKEEKVNRQTLEQLINIARFAPSAGNTQGLSYIIIESSDILQKITALTIDWMEELINSGQSWAKRYAGLVKAYRKTGKDVILRGAPHLLVATAPVDLLPGRDSGHFALAYVELFATTLGLGSCWAGYVENCAAAKYPPLLELLKVPEGKMVAGAIMVGYPGYTYKRLVDRNDLDLKWL